MLDRCATAETPGAIDASANAAAGAPAAMPIIARGLSFDGGGRRLLDGIDLVIPAGSITMVMGPNGAGKSLLLRLLHGLIEPTGGEILWGGTSDTAKARARQAMVFQRPVLLRRSAGDNIGFVLKLRGEDTRERREALLAHVGLLDRIHQPARLLSGGEQQRLALARALASAPEVLFLDEPTASLDPASVLAIEDIVREAHQRGTKIIFVTHDIGQASRLADDIIFLHRGRLAEHTPAHQFLASPATEAARALLQGRIVL